MKVTPMTYRMPRVLLYLGGGRPARFTPNVFYGQQVIGLGVRLWRLRRRHPRHPAYRMLSIVWARPGLPVTEPTDSEARS